MLVCLQNVVYEVKKYKITTLNSNQMFFRNVYVSKERRIALNKVIQSHYEKLGSLT